jgi:hypothetical protein
MLGKGKAEWKSLPPTLASAHYDVLFIGLMFRKNDATEGRGAVAAAGYSCGSIDRPIQWRTRRGVRRFQIRTSRRKRTAGNKSVRKRPHPDLDF